MLLRAVSELTRLVSPSHVLLGDHGKKVHIAAVTVEGSSRKASASQKSSYVKPEKLR